MERTALESALALSRSTAVATGHGPALESALEMGRVGYRMLEAWAAISKGWSIQDRWSTQRPPLRLFATTAAGVLIALALALPHPAQAASMAAVALETPAGDALPAVPPPISLTGDERARLVAGGVVTRSTELGGSERRAEALYLFDATPTELFAIVTEPAVLARIFEENEVYEAVATHDDGLSVHGIANVGWPVPRFEYWTRTRRDPAKLWNAWQQTRGDFDANDGYWRFAWDEASGKTIGQMSIHLSVSGLPDFVAVRLQETNLPKSMRTVAAEVARVRAQQPAIALARQAEWRTRAD